MWESLKDSTPDISKLLQICNMTSKNIAKTENIFDLLVKFNNNSSDLRNIMEIYADQIVYDELLSKKVSK